MPKLMRFLLPIVLLLAVVASSADACHGLLRRLFGPPRVVCTPAQALPVAPEVIPAPKPAPKAESTLEGRVTWENPPLPRYFSPLQLAGKNAKLGDVLIQALERGMLIDGPMVNPDNDGLANVVVFLKRPKDGQWPFEDTDKVRKDAVVIDAPLAVFEPRVVAFYPEWFDGKDRGKTGQKLFVKNSGPVTQNFRTNAQPTTNGFNVTLPTNADSEVTLQPQPVRIELVDSINHWKRGFAFVFDHPYFAITDTDGAFKIPRVPAGMEVQVIAWHETAGWLLGEKGITMKLGSGRNTLDYAASRVP
ncbi:MAG: hypothetical protein HY289_11560 [Planctomycetes bacterium]|nr:hypothetical protein [Planctomycetota bacterium]